MRVPTDRADVALYRDFRRQEEIDAMYRIDAIEEGFGEAVQRHADRSEAARDRLDHRLDIRYGPTLDETFDFFPSGEPSSPVLIFIHGGYWHAPNSAKDFSLVAEAAVARGVSVAVVDYSLTPKVSVPEISRQNRAAVAWIVEYHAELDVDPDRIVVVGHSAGGQQVAQLMLTDWPQEYGMAADTIKGGIAISGLFDLSPFPYSWLAPRVRLSHAEVVRESPLFNVRPVPGRLLLTYGGEETPEFARQTHDFLQEWQQHGNDGRTFALPGDTHMTAFEGLADTDSVLWRETESLFASLCSR